MRLDNERPSDNIEDQRGRDMGGGFGFPRGGGGPLRMPMGGGRGISLSTIILLVVAYFAIKLIFGIDLLNIFTGGGSQGPTGGQDQTNYTIPNGSTDVTNPGQTGGGVTTG